MSNGSQSGETLDPDLGVARRWWQFLKRPAWHTHAYNPTYERLRWQILLITWLAYFGFYLTRRPLAVAAIGMKADPHLQITDDDLAWINFANLIAYAVGQFIWGAAGDKIGSRWVVLIGLFGSIIASVLTGASSIFSSFVILLCLQGMFQSTGWAPLAKNVGNFFSQRERGFAFGLWSTNYAVGSLVGGAFAGLCGEMFGWRSAFYIPAATLVGVMVLFWLFQRNRPEDVGLPAIEVYHEDIPAAPVTETGPIIHEEGSWRAVWAVISDHNVMILATVYFLLKPARYAILSWGPLYINEKLHTDMTKSGLMSGLFEAAGIVSALSAGVVSDKLFGSRRMPVCVISLLCLGVFLFVFHSLPAQGVVLGAGLLLIGFLLYGPDSIIAGVAAADFGSKRGTSTAAGWINGWGSVGAIVGGTIPGFFKDKWGWSGVFSLFGGMVLLAGLILLPKWNAVPASAARKQDA